MRTGLGLSELERRADFAAFQLPDGSKMEVFGPTETDHQHFDDAPVVGLEVSDIGDARAQIEAAGGVFLGPVGSDGKGTYWAHFRGPDGNVYEITQR